MQIDIRRNISQDDKCSECGSTPDYSISGMHGSKLNSCGSVRCIVRTLIRVSKEAADADLEEKEVN